MRAGSTHSPLFVAKELLESRYEGAEAIFVAGSVIRGEASTYSDLDLVVVYKKIPVAFRESFIHRGWPVEAFVHDAATLRYFFEKVDRPQGRSTLAEMISEGHEIPGPSDFSVAIKTLADQTLREGPPALSESEIQDRRYHLSELVDDLRDPRSRPEMMATGAAIFSMLSDYYFRTRRSWSSRGKAAVRRMKKLDPVFARRFSDAFDALFGQGDPALVIQISEEVLAPQGGVLFEGYRREVAPAWRAE
jgi:hypothetical protein